MCLANKKGEFKQTAVARDYPQDPAETYEMIGAETSKQGRRHAECGVLRLRLGVERVNKSCVNGLL